MGSYSMEESAAPFMNRAQYVSAPSEIHEIRDWLTWSIINIFVGLGGGLLPLIFSIICISNKRHNDVSGARTMSTLALVFNIISMLGGIVTWIILVVQIVFFYNYMPTINEAMNTHESYWYLH